MGQKNSKTTKTPKNPSFTKSNSKFRLEKNQLLQLIQESQSYTNCLIKNSAPTNFKMSYNIPIELYGFLCKKGYLELQQQPSLVYYHKLAQKNGYYPIPKGIYQRETIFLDNMEEGLGMSNDQIQQLGMQRLMRINDPKSSKNLALMLKLIPQTRFFLAFVKELEPKNTLNLIFLEKRSRKKLLEFSLKRSVTKERTYVVNSGSGMEIFSKE